MDLEWPGELGTDPIAWALKPASNVGFQLKNDMKRRIVLQGGGCCPHLPAKVTGSVQLRQLGLTCCQVGEREREMRDV